MKILIFALASLLALAGCHNSEIPDPPIQTANLPAIVSPGETPTPAPEVVPGESTPYPGQTIDQVFSLAGSYISMEDEELKRKRFSIKVSEFDVNFDDFRPLTITKNGKVVYRFKTKKDYYWSALAGESALLRKNAREIYVVANGSGGVCCTNYWIIDVSSPRPRTVFRSEDYGYFRDPMEVFDAEGDSTYELVQFDSAFRYFLDDCGSCSPQPAAYFKYDKTRGKYLPKAGMQRDFEKALFAETETWIAETLKKAEAEPDVTSSGDYYRTVRSHVVDLFYQGRETIGCKYLGKYLGDKDERAEMKKRLKSSMFYQALVRSNQVH